jgi:hypothetical protein
MQAKAYKTKYPTNVDTSTFKKETYTIEENEQHQQVNAFLSALAVMNSQIDRLLVAKGN